MAGRKTRFLLAGMLLLSVTLAACGSSAPTETAPSSSATEAPATDATVSDSTALPEIIITAEDFSFKTPVKTGAGWVKVTLKNTGSEPHHVQFLRLNDGVTGQQFQDALAQGEGPAMELAKQVGGVGAVAAGLSGSAVLNLSAGEYVVLCFISSPTTQQHHYAMGMIQTMTVEDRGNTAPEPTASISVHLKDFSFDLPDTLPGGTSIVQVINDGPESHEFNIMRLEDEKSAGDVLQFLNGEVSGPPPFTSIGGVNGLDVGFTGYAVLNLLPGKYVAICNIPSLYAEGKQHFMLGMIKEFTVGDPTTFDFPFGTFVRTTDPEFKYIFRVNGIWELNRSGNASSTGTFSVDGNTYTETSNDQHCATNVSFTYTFDGTNLTFNYVGDPQDDGCGSERINSFDNVIYTLVKE